MHLEQKVLLEILMSVFLVLCWLLDCTFGNAMKYVDCFCAPYLIVQFP